VGSVWDNVCEELLWMVVVGAGRAVVSKRG
jgi:hypothetical protein